MGNASLGLRKNRKKKIEFVEFCETVSQCSQHPSRYAGLHRPYAPFQMLRVVPEYNIYLYFSPIIPRSDFRAEGIAGFAKFIVGFPYNFLTLGRLRSYTSIMLLMSS